MEFSEFKIENYKGIDNITINLGKSPRANIYTLVGLNESGKTTVLEAINLFASFINQGIGISALELPGTSIEDYSVLIPISKRDNFNGHIKVEATLKLEPSDLKELNDYAVKNTSFKQIRAHGNSSIKIFLSLTYKDSQFQQPIVKWTGFEGILKKQPSNKFVKITDSGHKKDNEKLSLFFSTMVPSILYFPNFLFDFPTKISLETAEESSAKEQFYFDLIQDILYSLDNGTNIETHLIKRIKSTEPGDKRSLNILLQKMGKKVTEVVFGGWNKIFKREVRDTEVDIKDSIDKDGISCLEFQIKAQDGIYQINERSLGFRWFFTFLLFTEFRTYRKGTPQNLIFLLDEPASNLHSSAQQQLLESFKNISKYNKIIYTTHSHYMINPKWLESTYVVRNEGLKQEDMLSYSIRSTKISIEPHRDFATNHPTQTNYFRPILDVLEYVPSNLENLPNCVLLEGKNDYYTIAYFKEVILEFNPKLHLTPGTGSGSLDTLISLYIGWGKEFIILLDSDKEGKNQKDRYIKSFGAIVEDRIFTFEDIDPSWHKTALEKLFESSELLDFQKTSYPDSEKFNKTHFNRTMQECLISKRVFPFSELTKNNFLKIANFLIHKLPK